MRIRLLGDTEDLAAGIDILADSIGCVIANDGIQVHIHRINDNVISIIKKENSVTIRYREKIHFFRAFGLLAEKFDIEGNLSITEKPQFEVAGAMFDVSRNAVLKTESIKTFLRKMALMGMNAMMLYTEDTYAVKDFPYFGYMRGRYSFDELKECDDYAAIFGIEIIPCIQTLAHLSTALRWKYAGNLKDTDDVLLAGSDEVYRFIETMIKAASAPFRSKRIHIGMDEAHGLGLGRYLSINGYRKRFDIMTDHLAKVVDITSKYGLKPMIWSDMYFRLVSKAGDYYDPEAEIPKDIADIIPDNVQLVYWDYYHRGRDFYRSFIKKHRKAGKAPVFAGGIWTFTGLCPNYRYTFLASIPALEACKAEGIKEVFVTMWGDDGAETDHFASLPGLQLYAEHAYARYPSFTSVAKRFNFCTGGRFEAFMDLGSIDEVPGSIPENADIYFPHNPSKYLLWQDVMTGLFDSNIDGLSIKEHFANKAKLFGNHGVDGEWNYLFVTAQKLCSVLELKSEIGILLKHSYEKNDYNELEKIASEILPELSVRIIELKEAHRGQWFRTCKPFGWEVLDIRYGGLLSRVDTCIRRIKDYLGGKTDRLEELEEERLLFDEGAISGGVPLCFCGQYSRIVTAGHLSQ